MKFRPIRTLYPVLTAVLLMALKAEATRACVSDHTSWGDGWEVWR